MPLKIKNIRMPQIETTTLWDFPTQNYGDKPHGDNKFNGVTPAFVIWNLLKRYTKKGDLVVDPMCGSGTTIDVANVKYSDHPDCIGKIPCLRCETEPNL